MAKKKDEVVPGPDPVPKIGEQVDYVWPSGVEPLALGDKTLKAKVLSVYDGFDGRLLNLEVDTGKGIVTIKSAPWRDDGAGNTWH